MIIDDSDIFSNCQVEILHNLYVIIENRTHLIIANTMLSEIIQTNNNKNYLINHFIT